MRVVFMGTPEFAASILSNLVEQHEVVGVFTRPDAVRKRGREAVPSPVKEVALKEGIPVFEHVSFKDETAFGELEALVPDIVVVAAYGAILPKCVLDLPKFGCVNVHASDLPRWRGAAPIERAILAGDEEAGVCIMRMEEGLDTGDYCVSRTMTIGDYDAERLTMELAELGSLALLAALTHIEAGIPGWIPQEEAGVTYADKLVKGELNLDPILDCVTARRRVQASGERHASRAVLAGKACTILRLSALSETTAPLAEGMVPGELRFRGKRLFLGFADGAVELVSVRPDGKKDMDAKAFAAGIQGIKNGGIVWEGIK